MPTPSTSTVACRSGSRARIPSRVCSPGTGGVKQGLGGAPEASVGWPSYGRRMSATTSIDEDRLNALLGQAVVEFGATVNAALVVIGDRLGLYRELAAGGPLTSAELARRTGTSERYVREWLGAQAASGWVGYDPDGERYSMSTEQAMMFADPGSPAFVGGAFQLALGSADAREHIAESFVTGTGFGWHEHDHDVAEGCRRFFEPGYRANLVQSWIPALDGVEERLRAGGRVADIC